MAAINRIIDIDEVADGWQIRGGKKYDAAGKALAAIKRQDKKAAAEGASFVTTTINWHYASEIGKQVVSVLTNSIGQNTIRT